jgi:alkylhydroperoxidase/carboxymuconolactone decarboxylase family protein YurZ
MAAKDKSAQATIEALGRGDAPTLETLVQMTMNTLERSGLDEETYMLVRIAALVAMDAAPMSYLMNIGAADEIGVPMERIQGTLVAIAPVVGTARTVSAAGKIVRALGLAEAIAEDADLDD